MGLAWLAFEIVWPVDWSLDPRIAAAMNFVPMATMLALVVIAIRANLGQTSATRLSPAVTAS
jgi:hypothetical protein